MIIYLFECQSYIVYNYMKYGISSFGTRFCKRRI
jgi:hypothetical protein